MRTTFPHALVIRLGVGLALASWMLSAEARAQGTVSFNRDIRPILSNNCFGCHGPDDKARKADLRLDTEDGVFADRGGRAAVVRGKAEQSELIARITAPEPAKRMPPRKSGKKLTAHEIDLLVRWVKQGAPFTRHWAYTKPVRPVLPRVKDLSWPKNPIDAFLLARLEREGLRPSTEADRYALVRRVSLDLTGLPPTLQEVDQFINDRDPQAYEKLVDGVLAKTAYGEHWAHLWLDLARYADSAGYADDPLRTIWLFRDYVIRALNGNTPFDQFTIEQIAGDLLPNPTQEQLIATAFHRNTLTNNEGGTDDEEFRNVAVVDRVNTTMAVWMGTTINCAQCHNHKYDPITQEEYFRFFALFNNTADADRSDEAPVLSIYAGEQQRQRKKLQEEISRLEADLRRPRPEVQAGQAKWERSLPLELNWRTLNPSSVKARTEQSATVAADGVIQVGPGAKNEIYVIEAPLEGTALQALRLETLPEPAQPSGFIVTHLSATVTPPAGKSPAESRAVAFQLAVADYAQPGFAAEDVLAKKPERKGWAIGGQTDRSHMLALVPSAPVLVPAGSKLTVTIEQTVPLGRFRLGVTDDARAVEWARTPRAVLAALATPAERRTPAQQEAITQHYRTLAPELQPIRQRLGERTKQLAELKPVTVPIMSELPQGQRRVTKIQHRGNFLDVGQLVSEGTPAAFPPLPAGAPRNRLTLAKWLVDENNPLTARVIANRCWEQIFGIGIVASSEEFGAQGEQPYHPELLDWLATELVRLRWDLKAFLKLLVTSAAYRQSSRVTPELEQRDPDNRLLARGPRIRLSAEMVRDQALFVSGLLSGKMYGPPVQPPQPALGINAAFGSGIDWQTSAGDDRYRRALYTMWRRSNPYPSMATFDAPNREVCTVRRSRTNTPLQALVTLNDPVYLEAAQALARKTVASGGPTAAERARYAFRLCLSRPPHEGELTRLVQLYEQALGRLRPQPEQARKLAADPLGPPRSGQDVAELAAWTVVGNVLLNLDEMLMKR